MKPRSLLIALLPWASLLACGQPGDPIFGQGPVLTTLSVSLDPAVAPGQEAYQCYQLDAAGARGRALHALRWSVPSSPTFVHHAMMFATSSTVATPGPVACEPRPTPVAVLPLYAPGGESTALADGVSLVIPQTAASFFVELHLVRVSSGSASASVELLANPGPDEHFAGWVDDFAAVPSLAPGSTSTSTARCRFAGPAHVIGSWPHMHRLGARFAGTIIRADGVREPLVDVPVWDFDHQPLHEVNAVLGEGDAVETACTWSNTTSATVTEGAFSTDEMCNQGLVIWPRESAVCVR